MNEPLDFPGKMDNPTQEDRIEAALNGLRDQFQETTEELRKMQRSSPAPTNGSKGLERFLRVVTMILAVIVLPAAGFVLALSDRVSRIEETRFTNLDGNEMKLELLEAIRDTQDHLEERIEGLPPQDTRDLLADHEARIRALERRGGGDTSNNGGDDDNA